MRDQICISWLKKLFWENTKQKLWSLKNKMSESLILANTNAEIDFIIVLVLLYCSCITLNKLKINKTCSKYLFEKCNYTQNVNEKVGDSADKKSVWNSPKCKE